MAIALPGTVKVAIGATTVTYLDTYSMGTGGDAPTRKKFFQLASDLVIGGTKFRTLSIGGALDPADAQQKAIRNAWLAGTTLSAVGVTKGTITETHDYSVTSYTDNADADGDYVEFSAELESVSALVAEV